MTYKLVVDLTKALCKNDDKGAMVGNRVNQTTERSYMLYQIKSNKRFGLRVWQLFYKGSMIDEFLFYSDCKECMDKLLKRQRDNKTFSLVA